MFRQYLIAPENANIPACSGKLGRDNQNRERSLDAARLTDQNFAVPNFSEGITNHPFIENCMGVVTHLRNMPNNLREGLRFAGLRPVQGGEANDDFFMNLEDQISGSIQGIRERTAGQQDSARNILYTGENSWCKQYLGEGNLGNENGGEWDRLLTTYGGNYKDAFKDYLLSVAVRILNDIDGDGLLIPYRIEYLFAVLDALRGRFRAFIAEVDRTDPAGGFMQPAARRKRQNALDEINRLDPQLPANVNRYIDAWKKRAEAERDLLGLRLIKKLANGFAGSGWDDGSVSTVDEVESLVRGYQETLIETQREIAELRTKHTEERAKKREITVREYLTDYGLDTYFEGQANDTFEVGLYHQQLANAKAEFLETQANNFVFRWEYGIPADQADRHVQAQKEFYLLTTQMGRARGAKEIAKTFAEWTMRSPSFIAMCSSAAVPMAKRIFDYFRGKESIPGSASTNAADSLLRNTATFMKLNREAIAANRDKKREYYIYFRTAADGADATAAGAYQEFYTKMNDQLSQELDNAEHFQYDPAQAIQYKTITPSIENPRAAVMFEGNFGFNIDDMYYWDSLLPVYNRSLANRAIHTTAEDALAAKYEIDIENARDNDKELKEILKGQVNHRFDMRAVDLFLHPKRLTDFLYLHHFGYIRPEKVPDGNNQEIVLRLPENRAYMLTDTRGDGYENDPKAIYGSMRQEELNDENQINRYKFYFAMRNFVLYGYDFFQPDETNPQTGINPRRANRLDYDELSRIVVDAINRAEGNVEITITQRFANWIGNPTPLFNDLGIIAALLMRNQRQQRAQGNAFGN